jgi:hypothetical protein
MLTTTSADAIGGALICFGIGTIGSVLVFAIAYFTQLQYGNEGTTTRAQVVHNLVYVAVLAALGGLHRRHMVRQENCGGSTNVRKAQNRSPAPLSSASSRKTTALLTRR